MMKESKTELEQNIDKIIESSRKISNIFTLETARLIKAALVNEKPVSELEVLQKMAKEREKSIVLYTNAGRQDLARLESKELDCIKEMMPKEPSEKEIEELIAELMEATTLTIKDTKGVIADVQSRFPTAQKSTIVKIFKSLL